MNLRITAIVILTLTAGLLADALPKSEDLQKLESAKDWTGLMKETSRILALRGPATADFNRVDVWMLKAEAQLQSNLFYPASQSFTFAADEKGATPEQRDLALATAALAKKSDHKGYQPKATNAAPNPPVFNIFDATQRKPAIAALFDEQSAPLLLKIDKLKTTLNETAITSVVKQIATLIPLDKVGNGSTDKTDAMEKSVGSNFVAATQLWNETSLKQLEELNDAASKITQIPYRDNFNRIVYRDQKAGLNSTQFGQIRKLKQEAKRLADTYEAITPLLNDAGKSAMEPAKPNIQRVYDRADEVEKDAVRPA